MTLFVATGCSKRTGRTSVASRLPPDLLVSREARERGRELFMKNCAICHGNNGDGHGARSVGMTPPPADLTNPLWSEGEAAPKIYQAIHDGVAGSAMPSWRTLNGREIWDLVAYVHSLGIPEETGATGGEAR